MNDTDAAVPATDHCPHCGEELVSGTIDFAGTPDETVDADLLRTEFLPGQMVQASTCATPGCPGPGTGAVV